MSPDADTTARAELARSARHWETNARTDAAFAVLSDPDRAGAWDLDAFLGTGEREIAAVLGELDRLDALPARWGQALDFGCGLGRLTAALARRFDHAVGVDVSSTMVERARLLHDDATNLRFVHNERDDLDVVPTGTVDLAYSNIVLQHVGRPLQERYLAELVRVLAPGGVAAVQVPSWHRGPAGFARRHLPEAVVPTARAAAARLRRPHAGFARPDGDDIHMEMHCLPEGDVQAVVRRAGGRVVGIVLTNATEPDFGGDLVVRTPDEAWAAAAGGRYLSPMYVVRRR